MLFMHNSYGTPGFPVCGNLVGADWMENLRWADTELSMHFRETNTDPSMHFRKANTNRSMHFRKAYTDRSMDFRKANTEFLFPIFSQLYSQFHFKKNFRFTPSFHPNITTNLLHHNEYNVICLSSNSKQSLLYSLCFVDTVFVSAAK